MNKNWTIVLVGFVLLVFFSRVSICPKRVPITIPNTFKSSLGNVVEPQQRKFLAFISVCTPETDSWRSMAMEIMSHYLSLYGVDYLVYTGPAASGRYPTWQKVVFLNETLHTGKYDYVLFYDCDAVILDFNFNITHMVEHYVLRENKTFVGFCDDEKWEGPRVGDLWSSQFILLPYSSKSFNFLNLWWNSAGRGLRRCHPTVKTHEQGCLEPVLAEAGYTARDYAWLSWRIFQTLRLSPNPADILGDSSKPFAHFCCVPQLNKAESVRQVYKHYLARKEGDRKDGLGIGHYFTHS